MSKVLDRMKVITTNKEGVALARIVGGIGRQQLHAKGNYDEYSLQTVRYQKLDGTDAELKKVEETLTEAFKASAESKNIPTNTAAFRKAVGDALAKIDVEKDENQYSQHPGLKFETYFSNYDNQPEVFIGDPENFGTKNIERVEDMSKYDFKEFGSLAEIFLTCNVRQKKTGGLSCRTSLHRVHIFGKSRKAEQAKRESSFSVSDDDLLG